MPKKLRAATATEAVRGLKAVETLKATEPSAVSSLQGYKGPAGGMEFDRLPQYVRANRIGSQAPYPIQRVSTVRWICRDTGWRLRPLATPTRHRRGVRGTLRGHLRVHRSVIAATKLCRAIPVRDRRDRPRNRRHRGKQSYQLDLRGAAWPGESHLLGSRV